MKNSYRNLLFLWSLLLLSYSSLLGETTVTSSQFLPRTIYSLHEGISESKLINTLSHQLADMPLNHLGLKVKYINYNETLPSLKKNDDIRGILIFTLNNQSKHPLKLLKWLKNALSLDKKVVVIGQMPFLFNQEGKETAKEEIDSFLKLLGIKYHHQVISYPYNTRVLKKIAPMVEFERPFKEALPAYYRYSLVDSLATSYLTIEQKGLPNTISDLVITHPRGGLIAPNYSHYHFTQSQLFQWRINFFEYFKEVYDTELLPKPDTTTLAGQRIFYSHIDGGGWNNYTEIPRFKRQFYLSSEVILEEVLLKFPEFPVTVGPIAADLDLKWHGRERSQRVFNRIFKLPYIQAGSHTYSQPFNWGFFEDYQKEKEKPFTKYYQKPWDASTGFSKKLYSIVRDYKPTFGDSLTKKGPPRSYGVKPFDLEHELKGSVEFINKLLPEGKKVEIFQWTGDTLPFLKALKTVRNMGLANINGGNTRLDRDFQSYTFVAPLGRIIQDEIQIFSSNSNENTYTNLWQDHYFGFQFLVKTILNTEHPIRIKPFNIYYHMYSGEKLSSLNAVLANFKYARQSELTPITTKHYSEIAHSFFTTRFKKLAPMQWEVLDNGKLSTIRFDQATLLEVDFRSSQGVMGQRPYQGSLYIALDPAVKNPLIALKKRALAKDNEKLSFPYLVTANWDISHFRYSKENISFKAKGFGPGQMIWSLPAHCQNPSVYNKEGEKIKSQVSRNRLKQTVINIPITPLLTQEFTLNCRSNNG